MTRGQIAVITPDGKISTSTEFNGDMYYEDGHGEEVFSELDGMETVEEYRGFVERFNAEHFKYDRQLFYTCDNSFLDNLIKSVEHINDNIYYLDGYGNLRNVDKGDFESLIDDISYRIQQELSPPKHDFSMG